MAQLFVFDLDNTLIASYMDRPDRDYKVVEPLPGRVERLAQLLAAGNRVAIATNQAGVAHGYIGEADFERKIARSLVALGLPAATPVAVCFADSRARIARYRDPVASARRKPSGAMIRELSSGYPAAEVTYIGDRPEDEAAARDAGVRFCWAEDFFSSQPG